MHLFKPTSLCIESIYSKNLDFTIENVVLENKTNLSNIQNLLNRLCRGINICHSFFVPQNKGIFLRTFHLIHDTNLFGFITKHLLNIDSLNFYNFFVLKPLISLYQEIDGVWRNGKQQLFNEDLCKEKLSIFFKIYFIIIIIIIILIIKLCK